MNREVCSDVKRKPTAPTTATLIGVVVVGILFLIYVKGDWLEEGRKKCYLGSKWHWNISDLYPGCLGVHRGVIRVPAYDVQARGRIIRSSDLDERLASPGRGDQVCTRSLRRFTFSRE